MNVQLALDATYCKLLEGKENRLECGMQNMSIHTNTISSYSGGLSQAYRDYSLGSQTSLGSGGSPGSFSCTGTSSSKTVIVTKMGTHDGKLVSLSSDVLPK